MNVRDMRGSSVAAVILILAVLTAIGVIFTSLFTTGVEEATGEVLSTRALYAAEAGVETAIGRLKMNPVSANWGWRDGYLDKAVGNGTFDVEVLQYEERDSTLAAAFACEKFESEIDPAVTNPPRTVYVLLSWASASNMGVELYDNDVTDCANPTASANLIASSLTSSKPERIRYRITAPAPPPLTYTVRVIGTAGDAYRLRIAHPQQSAFGTGKTCGPPGGSNEECVRAIISLGKHANARREVFAAMSRTP